MLTSLTNGVGLLALCGTALLFGCGGGGIGDKTNFRVMNAVPDQTSITVLLDGTSVGSAIVYGSASTYAETKSGSRHLQVEPASSTAAFLDQTFNLPGGTNGTAIISGNSSASSAIVLADDNTAPTTGNIKIRIVNASQAIGVVDVYVLPPGTDVTNSAPTVLALDFQSSSDYLNLAAGSYHIAFTPHGSGFTQLDTGTITFTTGQNRTIAVLNSPSGGFSIATLNDLN
jgi:hypothetical protein